MCHERFSKMIMLIDYASKFNVTLACIYVDFLFWLKMQFFYNSIIRYLLTFSKW